jgi:hypothetical protein
MRKGVVSEFVSLDGVMEDPSWQSPFRGEEQEKFKFAELAAAGARATDGKTLMTMVQRGFPSAKLRDEHRDGLPNAFVRLEQAIEERVSPPGQADSR